VWQHQVRQDYRGWSPLHEGTCNILFADGSVRAVADSDRDGYLNNGFPADTASGFASETIEMPPTEVASLYSLKATRAP
jgi:prepilin-type processing-associated H-X9-DG protein